MSRTLDEVTADALHLPKPERETLVGELLRSLESGQEPRFAQEQIAEWRRRLEAMRSGQDLGLTLDEFFSDSAQ